MHTDIHTDIHSIKYSDAELCTYLSTLYIPCVTVIVRCHLFNTYLIFLLGDRGPIISVVALSISMAFSTQGAGGGATGLSMAGREAGCRRVRPRPCICQ